jgi:hypothetical protein
MPVLSRYFDGDARGGLVARIGDAHSSVDFRFRKIVTAARSAAMKLTAKKPLSWEATRAMDCEKKFSFLPCGIIISSRHNVKQDVAFKPIQ